MAFPETRGSVQAAVEPELFVAAFAAAVVIVLVVVVVVVVVEWQAVE